MASSRRRKRGSGANDGDGNSFPPPRTSPDSSPLSYKGEEAAQQPEGVRKPLAVAVYILRSVTPPRMDLNRTTIRMALTQHGLARILRTAVRQARRARRGDDTVEHLLTNFTGLDMALCLVLLVLYLRHEATPPAADHQQGGLDTHGAD